MSQKIDKINALTLQDVWQYLLSRLVDAGDIPQPFFLREEGATFYERIDLDNSLTKPSLEDLNIELQKYKNELIVEENARIAEEERVKALEERISKLGDVRAILNDLGSSVRNHAIYLQEIIKNDDVAELKKLEAQAEITKPRVSEAISVEELIIKGERRIHRGMRILALINGINSSKENLTDMEVQRLLQVYSPIISALQTGSLATAKTLVEKTAPDAVMTAQDKSKILSELSR